jgi:two-component system chemotaxis response regulator CheB
MKQKGPLIRTLVVDDSPVVRNILTRALDNHPRIQVVGQAVDGVDACQKISALRPEVVTLDVEMPRLNGIGVLERVAGKLPIGFVMVSTLTETGAKITFEALQKGAIDYVTKPTGTQRASREFQEEVQRKVLTAYSARKRTTQLAKAGSTGSGPATIPMLPPNKIRGWLVGIGISCGGPQTLNQMLPAFPSDFGPILVTQHMPADFTRPFAEKLNTRCAMRVVEAEDNQVIEAGTIYIAPGSKHLGVRKVGVQLRTRLDAGPAVTGHKPSVDYMFDSLSQLHSTRVVGIVMTGMGRDGTKGIEKLHAAGCWTMAQDQATSLVYGMPKAAAQTGLIDQIVGLADIPKTVARLMQRGVRPVTATR